MPHNKTEIRALSQADAIAALPDLCETLADCVEGGASVGFMLPIARWIGYGGETDFHGDVLETMTWAAGLLAATKNIAVFAALRRVLAPKVRSQEPSAPGIWAQNVGSLATEVEEVLPVIACYHFVAAGKHFVGDDLRKVMDDYLATPADPIVETPITAEEFQEFILRMIEGACLAVFGFSATVRLRDPEHAPVAPGEQ